MIYRVAEHCDMSSNIIEISFENFEKTRKEWYQLTPINVSLLRKVRINHHVSCIDKEIFNCMYQVIHTNLRIRE